MRRSSLGVCRGWSRADAAGRRSHVPARAWQAGDPLGFSLAGGGQGYERGGVVRRCNWIRRPGLADEGSYMPRHGV